MKCCTLLYFWYICVSRKKLRGKRLKKMRAAFKNNHEGTNVNLVDDACASDMQNIFSLDEPVDTSIQRRAAQASDTIQRDEMEAATITSSPNEPVETSASPEALDQLVHQVYALICQRLAVERERYGLSRRR